MSLKNFEEINKRIEHGIKLAVAEALEEHKKAGRSIFVWKDGEVISIPAEEIGSTRRKEKQEDLPTG